MEEEERKRTRRKGGKIRAGKGDMGKGMGGKGRNCNEGKEEENIEKDKHEL